MQLMNATTAKIKGVGVQVRADGFCWKAVVDHLGGGGSRYYRFNGCWKVWVQSDIPPRIYRLLRKELRAAINLTLGRS